MVVVLVRVVCREVEDDKAVRKSRSYHQTTSHYVPVPKNRLECPPSPTCSCPPPARVWDVLQARNLPATDSTGLIDPYLKVKFKGEVRGDQTRDEETCGGVVIRCSGWEGGGATRKTTVDTRILGIYFVYIFPS